MSEQERKDLEQKILDEYREPPVTFIRCILAVVVTLFVLFLMFIFSGCKTIKYMPVVERHDSIVTSHDTLIIHDSIFVREHRDGDTVFIDRFVYKYIKNAGKDTIRVNKEVPVIEEVEVVKEVVPDWCWWLLGINIAFVIYKGIRLAIKIYTRRKL